MSINSMMKTYEVYENKKETDKWGATTNEEVKVCEVDVTINYSTTTNVQNDVRYAEITHFGLTRDGNLKQDQILKLNGERYVIHLPPVEIARFTQLFLKKVE